MGTAPPCVALVMRFARMAYLKDMRVSCMLLFAGEQLQNMSVFAVPPKESCKNLVKLSFLYGTCCCLLVTASITSPSADKDLLMAIASFLCSPVTSDFLSRSDPPKSMRQILPHKVSSVSRFVHCIITENMTCDRELFALMALLATARLAIPRSSRARSSAALATGCSIRLSTCTVPARCLTESFRGLPACSEAELLLRGTDADLRGDPCIAAVVDPRELGEASASKSTKAPPYISTMDPLTFTAYRCKLFWMLSKTSVIVRGAMPSHSSVPYIVKVFPAPVWP
mmetsp:Transcript_31609/g.73725  ORF Transcript_31609/g.73725 Transcript_31609/m.73725 type:complete len:284 (+) Transcript_31609:352-1203(+)